MLNETRWVVSLTLSAPSLFCWVKIRLKKHLKIDLKKSETSVIEKNAWWAYFSKYVFLDAADFKVKVTHAEVTNYSRYYLKATIMFS